MGNFTIISLNFLYTYYVIKSSILIYINDINNWT